MTTAGIRGLANDRGSPAGARVHDTTAREGPAKAGPDPVGCNLWLASTCLFASPEIDRFAEGEAPDSAHDDKHEGRAPRLPRRRRLR